MSKNEHYVRLFVAIDLPQSVMDEIKRIQRELQKENILEGGYTKAEQAHITMKFIGEVAENQIDAIDALLRQIKQPPYQAQLGTLDMFTIGDEVKIIYVRVIVPQLEQLAKKLNVLLQPWREQEEREFVSHITIARVKQVKNKQRLVDVLYTINVEQIEFTINAFVLKKSTLHPHGVEYETIKEYRLL